VAPATEPVAVTKKDKDSESRGGDNENGNDDNGGSYSSSTTPTPVVAPIQVVTQPVQPIANTTVNVQTATPQTATPQPVWQGGSVKDKTNNNQTGSDEH
jgi:hypothetical protein